MPENPYEQHIANLAGVAQNAYNEAKAKDNSEDHCWLYAIAAVDARIQQALSGQMIAPFSVNVGGLGIQMVQIAGQEAPRMIMVTLPIGLRDQNGRETGETIHIYSPDVAGMIDKAMLDFVFMTALGVETHYAVRLEDMIRHFVRVRAAEVALKESQTQSAVSENGNIIQLPTNQQGGE